MEPEEPNEPIDEMIPKGKTNEEIDKLTLELLLNKNHYSKYLQHTDTKKYDEFKTFKSKLKKHSIDIVDITSELI
jgi:molecular chaperone DnaK (HSP70)